MAFFWWLSTQPSSNDTISSTWIIFWSLFHHSTVSGHRVVCTTFGNCSLLPMYTIYSSELAACNRLGFSLFVEKGFALWWKSQRPTIRRRKSLESLVSIVLPRRFSVLANPILSREPGNLVSLLVISFLLMGPNFCLDRVLPGPSACISPLLELYRAKVLPLDTLVADNILQL